MKSIRLAWACCCLLYTSDGWIALAFVTSLPLLSGLCFYLSWKDVGGAITAEHSGASEQKAYDDARNLAKQSLVSVLASMGRAGLGILVACLFVCLLGTFWPAPDKHAPEFQAVLLASIAFMAVVSFASTVGPRRIDVYKRQGFAGGMPDHAGSLRGTSSIAKANTPMRTRQYSSTLAVCRVASAAHSAPRR